MYFSFHLYPLLNRQDHYAKPHFLSSTKAHSVNCSVSHIFCALWYTCAFYHLPHF